MAKWDHLSDDYMREWIRNLHATAAATHASAEVLERRADRLLAELQARVPEPDDSGVAR